MIFREFRGGAHVDNRIVRVELFYRGAGRDVGRVQAIHPARGSCHYKDRCASRECIRTRTLEVSAAGPMKRLSPCTLDCACNVTPHLVFTRHEQARDLLRSRKRALERAGRALAKPFVYQRMQKMKRTYFTVVLCAMFLGIPATAAAGQPLQQPETRLPISDPLKHASSNASERGFRSAAKVKRLQSHTVEPRACNAGRCVAHASDRRIAARARFLALLAAMHEA